MVVIIFIRLSFAPVLCVDPRYRLGVRESLNTSQKRTAPVFWPLLGLFLTLLLSSVATLMMFVLSFIFIGFPFIIALMMFVLPFIFIGLPFATAVMAAAYELITGEEDMDEG